MDLILGSEGIRMHFQPIFDIGPAGGIHAWEALARGPRGTHFETPAVLFEYARRKQQEWRVDRRCIAEAFAASAPLQPATVNVNVHASTLERDAHLASFVEGAASLSGIDVRGVVFEIVEQTPYWDAAKLRSGAENLRALGARFAVDDLGLGHCNFGMLLDVRPEYVKIDRLLVHGCAGDPYRLALLRSIVSFAAHVGALLVAEGVETDDDLDAVRTLRIPLAQGFLLARPAPAESHSAGCTRNPNVT